VSIGAYYQLEWRKSRLPAAGSYFSFADFVDEGGEAIFAPVPGGIAFRDDDIEASDSGQGGVQLKFRAGDTEYGIYAAQYHDKMPQFYLYPDTSRYEMVYAEDIRTVGFSFSTLVGETNVAGELSFREDMPLVARGNTVIVPASMGADGGDDAAFPKGRTMHVNLSAISVLSATPFWDGASFIGEFAYNRRLSVTDNKDQLDPEATRDAGALQFIFTPEYFQVAPGLDLQMPIGVSYGLSGRSSVNGALFPANHGGNVSVGLKAEYQKTWQASLGFTHYYGPDGSIIKEMGPPQLSYNNFHGDRDFVSLSVQRTF
jgi:hypothetical protein